MRAPASLGVATKVLVFGSRKRPIASSKIGLFIDWQSCVSPQEVVHVFSEEADEPVTHMVSTNLAALNFVLHCPPGHFQDVRGLVHRKDVGVIVGACCCWHGLFLSWFWLSGNGCFPYIRIVHFLRNQAHQPGHQWLGFEAGSGLVPGREASRFSPTKELPDFCAISPKSLILNNALRTWYTPQTESANPGDRP